MISDRIRSKFKDSSIAKSVAWSLGSKGSGAILQLAALPLAARTLGPELFGVYGVVSSVLSLLGTFNLGIGPSATKELSYAIETGNIKSKVEIFATSLYQATIFLVLIYALGVTAGLVLPMSILFGKNIAPFQGATQQALLYALSVASLGCLLSVIEAAQTAELQIYKANRAACIGVLLSVISIFFVFRSSHFALSPTTLVLLIFGVPLIPRVANCLLFLRSYDAASFKLEHYDKEYFFRSLKTNSKFTVMQLAAFLFDGYGLIWIGKLYGLAEAARVVILINLSVNVFGSVVMMILQPAWPLIARYYSISNYTEYYKIVKNLYIMVLAYSAVVFLGFVLVGTKVIERMYGLSLVPSELLLASVAAYYFLNRIETVGFMTLVASDADNPAMYGVLAKASIGMAASFILSRYLGPSFFYWGMFLGLALTTGWFYCFSIMRIMKQQRLSQAV